MKTLTHSLQVPETFEPEFQKYLHTLRTGGAYQITRGWRAQMNLILAIGAKYSHLTEAEWRGDDRDHLIYMLRATHLLGLKDTIMIIAGPDLRLVQAVSLAQSSCVQSLLINFFSDKRALVLFSCHWTCEPSMDIDRSLYPPCTRTRSSPSK
jgi:hypothetical protein